MKRPSAQLRNPALLALAGVFVISLVGLQGLSRTIADRYRDLSSFNSQSGSESDMNAMNQFYAALNALGQGTSALGSLAAASALALVFVWCFWPRGARAAAQSSDGTRMMSEAGSTVNLADTTVPNSSPSISNSSEPSTISMSTERPRE